MTTKVKNFDGFMKDRSKVNEQFDGMSYSAGANPEDTEDTGAEGLGDEEGAEDDNVEEEPVTLEDLKAMVEDLTERVEQLEGGGEGAEGEEGEGEEGAEGDEEGAGAEEEEK